MKTFQLTIANRLLIKQNFLGFGQSADIDIVFDDNESRKLAEVKTEDGKKEKYLLYYDGETVSGKVSYLSRIYRNNNTIYRYLFESMFVRSPPPRSLHFR